MIQTSEGIRTAMYVFVVDHLSIPVIATALPKARARPAGMPSNHSACSSFFIKTEAKKRHFICFPIFSKQDSNLDSEEQIGEG